jgi:hypothetical protein
MRLLRADFGRAFQSTPRTRRPLLGGRGAHQPTPDDPAEREMHMQKTIEFLKGKKTYIVATVAAATAFAGAMGWEIPGVVWELLGAVGLMTVRAALPARKE